MTPHRSIYKPASIFFLCSLLIACSQSHKNLTTIEKVQNSYNDAVALDQDYEKRNYGQPDPASFTRLKQYRSDAYQALMQFRQKFDKNKPLPKTSLENARSKIDQYVSYLNALGATSATKNTLTGF
ncbi:unnamed protein product [Commensalibacter communis]|uniref:Lipoprotein n=1 Tax=Commensalibacter communis TaxID=2972786 RepID=A0A9W4XCI5_9PROT|nr:hypothetical protein [Commensalibacter communis]CAI3929405.1 unnamed protein product [Commensalibacter communis]CAI3930935.1 unnamed protein product [Commensalibacter communis]CAI3931552.1 unnamed protein product [Commensalibacter communis]CAI3932086.1 unnamed protein product [Commensalibacter communis]